MKSIPRSAVFGALLACSGVAAAGSASLNEFPPKVMPVLVQVDSHGKVTSASPAIELSPKVNRLLRANLDEMITRPATDRHGRPVSSQFVINLALQASPLDNGNYSAQFTFLSTAPVPAGSWYWVHIDGHRLALAERDSLFRRSPRLYQHDHYRPAYPRSPHVSPMPPIGNTTHNSPTRSPPVRGR
ncbi:MULTISPECIES: hypothetical protein [Rhodanobacter]|uniref:Uncharacterized protein n=2 Tax=Rhodanobacter TaxID=75309 RepID=I4W3M6_9GAMM|nr:hypothetical protein [Rhodanobacter spathiphylli]EIL94067.1 hypothetical protein UU7_05678 [Rhodanobacter spathiphylli B39]